MLVVNEVIGNVASAALIARRLAAQLGKFVGGFDFYIAGGQQWR